MFNVQFIKLPRSFIVQGPTLIEVQEVKRGEANFAVKFGVEKLGFCMPIYLKIQLAVHHGAETKVSSRICAITKFIAATFWVIYSD